MPRHRNANKKSTLAKTDTKKAKQSINDNGDYIASKRFNYSLKEFSERYPNGAPNKAIASALMLTEQEIEEMYENIVLKARQILKINL